MPYLDSVEELLEAKEGEHVQFKEAKNRFDFGEAARCCCALANDGGGKLVFGISDKRPRSVVGSRAFEQPERTRMGLIDKLKINVDFQLFTYEEKRVLVFDVKSRPIGLPILYEGVAWIYDGDTLKEMPEEKRRKIYEEIGTDFSGKICDGATIKDLDETAIEAFRAKWIEKSGNKKLATRSKEQILIDCGAMTDAGVTYAALILFGKSEELVRFLPQAEILSLCGMVERSGQGMNLMFELSVQEAKPLPDFTGTDDFFVSVTLNGLILDKAMLSVIHRISDKFMEPVLSTEDFLVIDALYHERPLDEKMLSRLGRLTEMGIVEHIGRKKYVLARSLYAATGKTGVHTRHVGLDRDTNKELLLKHIRANNAVGTPFKELQQVLPGLNRGQIQVLMRELRDSGKVVCKGKTSAARWFAVE